MRRSHGTTRSKEWSITRPLRCQPSTLSATIRSATTSPTRSKGASSAMAKFNVTVAAPEGSTIHHAFDEIHDSLCWALSALGHQVSKTENWLSESRETNIVLGQIGRA